MALAERLDEDITAFTRKLAGRELSPAGELRVTTNDTLLVHLLTPLFAAFLRQCPDVRLDVVLGNQALNLSKRDADVAIRATDNPPETLVGRRVAAHRLGALRPRRRFPGTRRHPDRAPVRPRLGFAWRRPRRLKAVRFVREHVPPERIVYRINTVLGLAEAVEAGIGIGHLPCFIARRPACAGPPRRPIPSSRPTSGC